MFDIKKITIHKDSSIKQALNVITDSGSRIAIIVSKNGKFLGTITDGDIRRGFLKGLNLSSQVSSIFCKKPIVSHNKVISKSLIKKALSKKIYQIPIVSSDGRLTDLHIIDNFFEAKKKSNLVIIMAGGEGARLMPMTKNTPKPMLKVGNKPILETILEKFKECGFINFIFCLNYKSKIIKDYFGDGTAHGVKISYIHEKNKMGTAGALSLIKKKPLEPFFVINGDILTNLNFDKMLDFHIENASKATMCVNEYNIELPYGEIKLKGEKIISIKEKPKHNFYVNTGIYILDPISMNFIPKGYFDMPSLFTKFIENKSKVISFPLGEYWLDIGRHGDFKKANDDYHKIFK